MALIKINDDQIYNDDQLDENKKIFYQGLTGLLGFDTDITNLNCINKGLWS